MMISNPSNSLEWMIFLAQKYSSMFIKGTWLTLYISVVGTLLGFVLGYIVGIVNDVKLNDGDNIVKKVLIRIVKVIFTVYVEVFRDTPMIVQAMIVYYGIRQMGKAIASQLAKELGIHCYENRILTLASQLSGLDENVFQEVNEKLREEGGFTSFLRGLPRAKGYISRNEKFKSDDRLFEYQSQIINELADKESCVIVGKCADYVLKNRPNVVSIYIEAPRAFCVERTIANMGVTPEVANATIERTDKFRADYYKYYTHGNYWTNPVNYDLTLNSERVGVENCVKTIEQYLIIKGFIKADMIKPVGELI